MFLPMTLMIMLVASRAGKLVSRFGVRAVLGSGLIMMTAGMLLFSRIGSSGSPIVYVMIPGLLTAAGIAMSIVPSTIAATQGAKQGQAGLASGLVNTSRQVGGGLGLAVLLITLATQHSTHLIGTGEQVPQALTDGFRLAYLIGAGLAARGGAADFTRSLASDSSRRNARPTGALARERSRRSRSRRRRRRGFVAIDLAFAGNHGAPIGAYTTDGAYSFVTAPSLHPPKCRPHAPTVAAGLAPGYIFTTNFYDLNYPPLVGQSGPLILDRRLQPVWFQPVPNRRSRRQPQPADATRQAGARLVAGDRHEHRRRPKAAKTCVVDQHYRTVATLKGKDGWMLTLHELLIDGERRVGDREQEHPVRPLEVRRRLQRRADRLGGPGVRPADRASCCARWDALDHIPLERLQATLPTNGFPWDAYHVNSVQLDRRREVPRLDARHLGRLPRRHRHAARSSGRSAAGTRASSSGRAPRSSGSTTSRWQPGTTVTMFDDHCCQLTGGGTYVPATGPSRGLDARSSTSSSTPRRSRPSTAAEFGLNSDYMGDAQPLPNGNVLVGWGSDPYFSEYGQLGQAPVRRRIPVARTSPTGRRGAVGRSAAHPARRRGAAHRAARRPSTRAGTAPRRVASWRVLAGAGTGRLTVVASAPVRVRDGDPGPRRATRRFEVQALDGAGHVIGASQPFAPRAAR